MLRIVYKKYEKLSARSKVSLQSQPLSDCQP